MNDTQIHVVLDYVYSMCELYYTYMSQVSQDMTSSAVVTRRRLRDLKSKFVQFLKECC